MARMSCCFFCVMNMMTLLISMIIVGQISKTWRPVIIMYGSAPCAGFLKMPILSLGISILIASVIGLIALFCRVLCLHRVYLWVMLLIIIALFSFIVFSLLVTSKGPREESSGREYSLRQFSGWLRRNVVDVKNWFGINNCLVKADVCNSFGKKLSVLPAAVVWEVVSPVESGCCKPPPQCGYKFKNVSYWEEPKSGLTSMDVDCVTWKNEEDTVCYSCESCKAGYLVQVRDDWLILNAFNICFLIYLLIVLAIGFFSLPNPSEANKFSSV
ncbi:tetraspanin-8 [Ricinus communis]|uniref:Senescence-associated protein n=1 Tax=Ricinus communis TaxID=3988 RepID=B9S1M5_RICCO|nr:tetraspanin-8 [Ricinus communis]EEF42494.1 conserved hypothetical protein [Ricinus communis]|eukprot:XP_002519890.3 tetraspanin-8 [Ricinus communis]